MIVFEMNEPILIPSIQPALQQFPDKEYLLMTQPYKSTHTPLHNYFTFVPPKPTAIPFPYVCT